MEMDITTACDAEGNLVASKVNIVSNCGAYASLGGPVLQRAGTHSCGPYHFDNFAFDEVITATATKHSPWYAIPADQKWYTRYLVSEIVLDALQKSCHEYPVLSDDAKAELLNCKAALEQE